jgi:SPFH domain / Band 7 family
MKAYLWSDAIPPPATRRARWRRFAERYLPSVVIYLMVATLAAVALYPHVAVTVPSGHVGVLWKRFAGGTVLDPRRLRDEGLHLIWPWDRLFLYDLRLQSFTESYNAISSDGVSLTASVIVRFRLQRDAVPVLHQAIGPNYEAVLVQPGIGSLTREVIAQYTAEQVYSTARQEIQEKIRSLVEDRLSEKMMEHEGEESYRVSMRDTVILYDILDWHRTASSHSGRHQSQDRAILHCGRVQVSSRARKTRIGTQEHRGRRHSRLSTDRQPRYFGILSALARRRSNASAVAIDEFEGCRHRQWEGRATGHSRRCKSACAPARGEHAERE